MAERYEVVVVDRVGREHTHEYLSEESLQPGDVIRVAGRDRLVVELEGMRVRTHSARYRLWLRHPDGRLEGGAIRRYRPDLPRVGHGLTTLADGAPVSWEVVETALERDDAGEPYLALYAERDYGELEGSLPDHELEHTLARRDEEAAEGVAAAIRRAVEAGLSAELVALDPGEAPDWEEAQRYIAALTLDTLDDDLVELCGVDTLRDPPGGWLDTVKERLAADLERLRADLEGDRDEVESWDFRDGRIFAALGSPDEESEPDSPHGWLVRLVDAGVLGAAGFARVRKAELLP